jgi:ATP/ADP translocase
VVSTLPGVLWHQLKRWLDRLMHTTPHMWIQKEKKTDVNSKKQLVDSSEFLYVLFNILLDGQSY